MLWLILIAFVTDVKPSEGVLFNCSRYSQHCQNAGFCNARTGLCVCRYPFAGFNCQADIYNYTVGSIRNPCSLNCENGGTCMKHISGFSRLRPDFCLCAPDYIGPTCQQRRVSVSCGGSTLNLTFTPVYPYWGVAYTGESPDVTRCRLEGHENQGTYLHDTFSQIFPLDTSCDGSVAENKWNGDVVHTRQLHVQFNSLYISTEDLVYDVTCIHSSSVIARTGPFDLQETQDAAFPPQSQAKTQVQAQAMAQIAREDERHLGAGTDGDNATDVSIQAGSTGNFVAVIKLRQTGEEMSPPASLAVTIANLGTVVTLCLLSALYF